MDRLRQLLRQGAVDVVLAHVVDRLSRNQNQVGVVFDEIEQAGARLECVLEKFEDTPEGRFILAARAFIAEVERAKILERTSRGKTARARAGKLPQATGKGIYGYRYDPSTARRAIDARQGAVVRRIFADFVAGVPLVALANRLNAEGIPTFGSKRWYPATLYHLLRNETYTGRTFYRRTAVERRRDPTTGKARRHVVRRADTDVIEIVGATPALVDAATFDAVQRRLDDPERLRQGRRVYDYALSGQVQCLQCGRAMVGQTLQRRFRYYRCRAAFAGPKHDRCQSRYVRAGELEQAVRDTIAEASAQPERIISEYHRLATDPERDRRVAELQRQLENLDGQKQRLAKLYQLGEVDDSYFEREARALRAQRSTIEAKLGQQATPLPQVNLPDLSTACAWVRAWVQQAAGDDLELLLSALQVRVKAETERGELTGVIPDIDGYASPCNDADVCAMVGSIVRMPFTLDLAG